MTGKNPIALSIVNTDYLLWQPELDAPIVPDHVSIYMKIMVKELRGSHREGQTNMEYMEATKSSITIKLQD